MTSIKLLRVCLESKSSIEEDVFEVDGMCVKFDDRFNSMANEILHKNLSKQSLCESRDIFFQKLLST
jgi:hypothetical protein